MGRTKDERRGSADDERRRLTSKTSGLAMFAGLLGGYGAFAWLAGRFLYPARPRETRWMFVTETARMREGDTLLYEAPTGETINVTCRGEGGDAVDFIALSSTCPHLGCHVHWEPQNNRYFCPCHNGVFDPSGKATAGPPGEAGQSLSRYRLKVESGLLFMEVPVETLADARQEGRVIERVEGIRGPGHDPCLASLPPRRPDRTGSA